MSIQVFDLEVFPNFFYGLFFDLETKEYIEFRIDDLESLKRHLESDLTLIGFNSKHYDSVVLRCIAEGLVSTCAEVYELSTKITSKNLVKPISGFRWKTNTWNDVDLMNIHPAFGRGWSLKKHQVRMKWPDVRDLPYPFDSDLTSAQKKEIEVYCRNDVDSTAALYENFNNDGILDTCLKVSNEYGFIGNQAFFITQSQIGSQVMKYLYRVAAGVSQYQDVYKPKTQSFNPKLAIDERVSFREQSNIDALEHLKSLPPGNVIDIDAKNSNRKGPSSWAKSNLSDLRFQAGDLSIPLGVGGLHSDRHQGSYRGNIIDFDVTSYYPSIIKMLDRVPQGVTAEWMSEYMKPFNKRLELKAEGDNAGADAMKIVINAVYGQLNYPKSDSFDPALQMAVTINGQLFLLMLAERFAAAGFLIISANTDGITIDVGNREKEAVQIADQWSEDTGFNLEQDAYDLYVSQNVNNYFAYNSKSDKMKRKGFFKTITRQNPVVVANAVMAHYKDGVEVSDSIANASDIFDFLIVGTSKAEKVLWQGQTLQKTNRWYKGTDGASITIVDGDKRGKLPNSDSAVPVNYLDNSEIPDNLDRQYYIDEALKIIRNIDAGIPSTRIDTNELLYTADKLAKMGLTVQPKGRTDSPKANLPGPIPSSKTGVNHEDYPWYQYNGVGVVTGKGFNTIAIDIDYLEEAVGSGIFKFTQRSVGHLCSYHGKATAKEVRAGGHRGTLLFQYDGDDLHSTGNQFLKKYGFEVLYGNKVVQMRGVHETDEPYAYSGTIKPIPPKLLAFLKTAQETITEGATPYEPNPIVAAVKKVNARGSDVTNSRSAEGVLKQIRDRIAIKNLEAFAVVANQDEYYQSIGGELHIKVRGDKPRLEGFCPVVEHADDRGEPFTVTFVNDQFYCNCFHTACAEGRPHWLRSIVSRVELPNDEPPIRRITELSVIASEGIEEKNILDALRKPDRYKLITAGTGAGKTFASTRLVAEQLAEHDATHTESDADGALPIKVLHLVPSKDAMFQVMSEYQDALGDDPREFGIDMIDSTGTMKVGGVTSRKKPRLNTRVVITHFTYFGRKGDSWHHYGIAGWVDSNTDVIIDEVDSFFESQTYRVPLGWRGKRRTVQGKVTYTGMNQCPAASGSGNCASCRMSKYNGHTYIANNHNNLEYKYRQYLEEELLNTTELQNNHVEFEHLVEETVQLNDTTEVKLLSEYSDVDTRDIRFEAQDTQMSEFHEWVIDLINTSFAPTAWRSFISGPNGEMSTDEVKDLFLDPNTGKVDTDAARKTGVQFPIKICNQVTLAMIDKITFNLFSTAKSLTVLTATLPKRKRAILDRVYDGLVNYSIPTAEDRKIDRLIVVGTSRKFNTRTINRFIAHGPQSFGRMLVFKPTKKKAHALWDNIRRDSNHNIVLARDKNSSLQADGLTINNIDADIVVSHSYGSLGRGMNLAEFSTMFIDSAIYKPAIAYNITDGDELNLVQQEERAAAIIQNSGRFLRLADNDDGFRMLIVSGLHDESEIEVLKSAIQPMVKQPIDTLWWNRNPEDESELVELLAEVYERRGVFDESAATVESVSTIGDHQSARFSKQTKKWLKKIVALRDDKNMKWGKIKSHMNYNKFSEEQQNWFDTEGRAEYSANSPRNIDN